MTQRVKPKPEVDAFVDRAETWQAETKRLRALLLDCGLDEELKWKKPCYTFEGANVAIGNIFEQRRLLPEAGDGIDFVVGLAKYVRPEVFGHGGSLNDVAPENSTNWNFRRRAQRSADGLAERSRYIM